MCNNIKRSKLPLVTTHPTIFPCSEIIEWIIDHLDIEARQFKDSTRQVIVNFRPESIEKLYKLQSKPKCGMHVDFGESFHKHFDTKKIIASWWVKDK